jgi:hypothetical protein
LKENNIIFKYLKGGKYKVKSNRKGQIMAIIHRCSLSMCDIAMIHLQLSWFGAQKFCRKMGLVLGSLENREKVEQFQIMLRSLSIKNHHTK